MPKARTSCNIGLSQFDSNQRCSVMLQTPLNLLNHPFQADWTLHGLKLMTEEVTMYREEILTSEQLRYSAQVITEECEKAVAEQVRRRKRVPEATKQRDRVRVRRRKGLGERGLGRNEI